ncbi:hypothetical protein [Roseibium marinum]|uniref:Uncharacterized protein n=1 Tax=Roseibium marinum TaxID=281252 RepID=A0A2S3UN94_9HYPH|nr:hypothetical protein [Roseibium marinum]POF29033.1 hypothetical protein CLV41_11037 [Roseibium marinum]
MLSFKKTMTPVLSALFVSTALVGSVQAEGVFNGDANGEEPLKPAAQASANIEAQADSSNDLPLDGTKDMVGDLNGEEPLTLKQQAQTNAEAQMDASDDLPADGTRKIYGDLSGDEPTNQPMIDTDDS